MLNTLSQRYPALYKDLNHFGIWILLAIFSLLTTLFLPYQGEEAVYTITTMEMNYSHEWLVPTQYGDNYARPPLLNWIMLPLAMLLGWDQVLVASRLLTVIITVCTCMVLIWFSQKCFKDRSLALFSALVYLSGDVLFRRGWLAYADPLFTLFVFGAIAALWVAVQEKRLYYLFLAALAVIASYLTKAITGYVFYGIAVLVLFFKKENQKFLLSKSSIAIHLVAGLFPLLWNYFLSDAAPGGSMLKDVLVKLNLSNILDYGIKILLDPIHVWVAWLPLSGLLTYYWIKQSYKKTLLNFLNIGFLNVFLKKNEINEVVRKNSTISTLLWIIVLNYTPYWLAPVSHMRYIMPLYPLIALVFAYLIWAMGQEKVKVAFYLLAGGVVLRFIAGLWFFPFYEQQYRADYKAIAQDIISLTQDKPVYILDVTATGLSVTANIDVLRMPMAPISVPPLQWDQGYVLANDLGVSNTRVTKTYCLGRHPLYLLCKGEGC